MNKIISYEIINNEKLLNHFMEQSYWYKNLNRNPNSFKDFKRHMKTVYKERPTDKISNVIDSVEVISSIIDTL